jgi:hypothetical protein
MKKTIKETEENSIDIRLVDMLAVEKNLHLLEMEIVFSGEWEEILVWAKKNHLVFHSDDKLLFGGYFVDTKTGDSYLPS